VLRWDGQERLPSQIERRLRDLGTTLHGVGAYQALKAATEMFLLLECGVRIDIDPAGGLPFDVLAEEARLGEPVSPGEIAERLRQYLGHRAQLPYITRVVDAAFPDLERVALRRAPVLVTRINDPCLLELIWSYWHEEGMLMQTINAVSHRFQNVRRPGDALFNLEIDPLRPVNNLLWGYIQDEVNRLTVSRRAYEYLHEYGLAVYGRATASMQPADTRSKFLEAFHNLLYQSSKFFKEDFQTTVIADGFPLLNALQEVHLVLAQGAHNQFGDLPWTARVEMLLAQLILSRPELRDFLQSRVMVPYKEAWMPQVDMLDRRAGHALPRPGRLRRAAPALGPLRRLDRRQRRELGEELGAVLAAGDPGLPARVSRGHRRGSDAAGRPRRDGAGAAAAAAAGDAAAAPVRSETTRRRSDTPWRAI
jgi:hypothetical protein